MAAVQGTVPLTVVSGFEGVGKSSLIHYLIETCRDRKITVLHDNGDKDILTEIEGSLVGEPPDVVLIHCAAGLLPEAIAEYLKEGEGRSFLPEAVTIDTLVTVVSAPDFLNQCMDSTELLTKGLTFDTDDDRVVAEVVVEQVEYADVLVINKIDLVDDEELTRVEALLYRLNPRAVQLRAQSGKVLPENVIETGLFDSEEIEEEAGWIAELHGDFDDLEQHQGVSSFTFFERRPFHPIRFNELLAEFSAKGLVRIKGLIWVATRHNEVGIWSYAGQASLLLYGGAWYAATPAKDWPTDGDTRLAIMQDWAPPFGDRRQEIAIIGIDMDESEIKDRLEECLLSSQEMKNGPESWSLWPDPLPDWHSDSDSGAESVPDPDVLS